MLSASRLSWTRGWVAVGTVIFLLGFLSIYHDLELAEQYYRSKDWYFSILTATFVFLPSPMMSHLLLDRATASFLNIIWGSILAGSGRFGLNIRREFYFLCLTFI